MIHTSKQLKDKVRNISKEDNEVAKALIRIFMMERFLERVSLSKYKNNFILKGGMLVASIVGVDMRATMDISTDDVITPAAVEYEYKLMFEDRTISLLSYNTETLLAEKMQTIIARGLANTRMRDFYDVCGIVRLNADKIDYDLLVEAFQATCKKRETVFSISEIEDTLSKIKNDEPLAKMWERFRMKNFFVGDLQWEETLQEVLHIMGKLIE